MSHTILTSENVESILHLHNLAVVPLTPNQKISDLLITKSSIQYSFKFAFHDLRMKIQKEKKHKLEKYLCLQVQKLVKERQRLH